MKEKDRFEIQIDYKGNRFICDTHQNIDYKLYTELCDLLNQQDKRIKELEEENKKIKINNYLADYFLAYKENQQLKQQLHDLPKKIVEDCKMALIKWRGK